MTYVKVSIPRASDNAGAPMPKNPTIIVVDADDVASEPTRSPGNIALTGDLTLKDGAVAVGIYATPTTIQPTEETSGDLDARGVIKGVQFDHPGDSAAALLRPRVLYRPGGARYLRDMNVWDAIKEMREMSGRREPFGFSFMSYNSTAGTSDGVVAVRHARLLERESVKYNRHAESMEKYLDLDTMQVRHFWQPLLMTFNGEKVTFESSNQQ